MVTVSVNVPSGLPIAIAVCPDLERSPQSPMTAGLSPLASILISARSVVVRLLDDRRRELAAVGQLDGQRLAAGHDVPVGQDVAVGRQDDARTDAGRRDLAEAARRRTPPT